MELERPTPPLTGSVDAGRLRHRLPPLVAITDPLRMRTNPTAVAPVNLSPRSATPSTTATAGLTYVITVARTGPDSAIRAKKSTNARAVQTIPSATTEAIAR